MATTGAVPAIDWVIVSALVLSKKNLDFQDLQGGFCGQLHPALSLEMPGPLPGERRGMDEYGLSAPGDPALPLGGEEIAA